MILQNQGKLIPKLNMAMRIEESIGTSSLPLTSQIDFSRFRINEPKRLAKSTSKAR